MIPALGAYYRPQRLEEALRMLASEPGCEVLAGGTDLLLGDTPQGTLLDVMHLGLDRIELLDANLVLGGMLRLQDLLESPLAADWADGILVGACLEFGTLQVRNMATVGGNVVHALPAADLVPALLALDAQVELARAGTNSGIARRTLPLDGFAVAPFRTVREASELLVAVHMPAHTRGWRAQFRKVGRVLKDLAQVNAAVSLDLDASAVRDARVVLGAVHPIVVRVRAAEDALRGGDHKSGDWPQRVERAVEAVRAFVRPITDIRASEAWRRHVAGVLVARCVQHCADPSRAGRTPRIEDGPSYRFGADQEDA